jgi:hypothetical protein
LGLFTCVCVCESGEEETEESLEKICRETRYPFLYWSTAYRFPVLRVQVCVYCAGLVLRVLGPKGLLSVYPTWVSGYCPTSLGSYNSLLSSPYFYVQKSVGISNSDQRRLSQRRTVNDQPEPDCQRLKDSSSLQLRPSNFSSCSTQSSHNPPPPPPPRSREPFPSIFVSTLCDLAHLLRVWSEGCGAVSSAHGDTNPSQQHTRLATT